MPWGSDRSPCGMMVSTMDFCLAPLLLVGYAFTMQTDWHRSANMDAPYVQVQTCKTGFGLHGKVSGAPWVTGGVHYGFTWRPAEGEMEITLQPHLGLSYFNYQVLPRASRQIGRFEVGAMLLLSYRDAHVGLEYIHLSNGEGWEQTNVGMDLIGVQTGWRF